jgi:hypothetical protein
MDTEEVNQYAKQYVALKQQMKFLSERESELKKRLLESVEAIGEIDARGHTVLEVDGIKLTKQRKESQNLDMDIAKQILQEHGLEESCTKVVTTLDQDAIMIAYAKDLLTEEEIEKMFPVKVSYAFLVNG